MDLKALKNLATSSTARKVLLARKHSPVALFAIGMAGFVGTVVLASRATLKLEEVVDETQQKLAEMRDARDGDRFDYSEREFVKDATIVYARTAGKLMRLYGPAFVVGSLSVASLTSSHVILTKRNTGLIAAYAALETGFSDYRRRVEAELGPEKEQEIRLSATPAREAEVAKTGEAEKRYPESLYSFVFDENSTSWSKEPMYNQVFLKCQQNYANDLLNSRGHVFLNEVLDMLGIKRTTPGAVVGWVKGGNGDDFIDFGIFDGDEYMGMRFVNGDERSVWLHFNVDGVIYDKI